MSFKDWLKQILFLFVKNSLFGSFPVLEKISRKGCVSLKFFVAFWTNFHFDFLEVFSFENAYNHIRIEKINLKLYIYAISKKKFALQRSCKDPLYAEGYSQHQIHTFFSMFAFEEWKSAAKKPENASLTS